MIKDSGERTEFETGAKRDMHAGKGRMDLLPWYGIMEVSKHCEEGALKYGEHNVDKGIPLHSLLDSASRHLAKYMVGMDDEDHLRAACWNLLWALNQRVTHPELDDRFVMKVEEAREDKNVKPKVTLICKICGARETHPKLAYEDLMRECPTALIQCPNCREYSMVPEEDYRVATEVKQEPLDELAVHTRCLKCGDVHKFYKQAWDNVPYLYESDIKIAMCPRCREKTAHFTMVKAEDKKKSHQLLCPNCEATIIKEHGQICDGVAWRVGVPNEKVELRCSYCNRAVIISIKDIVDERIKGKTDE